VVIVSPSLLMLAIQVMQQILKDARMREAADLIRAEVGGMMEDVGRLRDRVLKLQQHHGQAAEDMRQIIISTEKVGRRAGRIDALDFSDSDGAKPALAAVPLRLQAGE
jgi:DNA recombination protein RmuC